MSLNQLRITNYELRIKGCKSRNERNFASLRLCVFAGISFIFCLLFVSIANAQGLPAAAPTTVGMNAAKLNQIDALVEKDIADKKLPGAVVIVGHKGKVVYRKAFGNRALSPTVEKMTIDTIFDAASLTKPIATATSVMILVEQGKLRLNDTIGKFISEIDDENAKKITIQQLLTHVSGYRPDFDLGEKWTGRDGMLAALKKEKLRNPAGTRFVYSDIGFIVLGEIVERLTEKSVANFSFDEFLQKLNMSNSLMINQRVAENGFIGNQSLSYNAKLLSFIKNDSSFAPTENIKGQNNYLGAKYEGDEKTGNQMLRGQVHDPTAFRMGGVAGHAGLFSTADDLARYCQMMLNGGILDGKRILSAQTVAKMTAPYVVSEDGATRGLGWDMNTSFSSNRGELFPLGSFGHTGFTGTSVWIDRVTNTFVVFMSNRVHPNGKGDVTPLRAKVATVAAAAVEDTPIEMIRAAEDAYSSQVAAQIPKFREQLENSRRQTASNTERRTTNQTVLNGIDVLEKTISKN